MKSFRKELVEDAENSGEKYPPLPCRNCGHLTPVPTLNSYGALCGPCYAEYCRHPPPRPRRSESATAQEMRARVKGHIGNVG